MIFAYQDGQHDEAMLVDRRHEQLFGVAERKMPVASSYLTLCGNGDPKELVAFAVSAGLRFERLAGPRARA